MKEEGASGSSVRPAAAAAADAWVEVLEGGKVSPLTMLPLAKALEEAELEAGHPVWDAMAKHALGLQARAAAGSGGSGSGTRTAEDLAVAQLLPLLSHLYARVLPVNIIPFTNAGMPRAAPPPLAHLMDHMAYVRDLALWAQQEACEPAEFVAVAKTIWSLRSSPGVLQQLREVAGRGVMRLRRKGGRAVTARLEHVSGGLLLITMNALLRSVVEDSLSRAAIEGAAARLPEGTELRMTWEDSALPPLRTDLYCYAAVALADALADRLRAHEAAVEAARQARTHPPASPLHLHAGEIVHTVFVWAAARRLVCIRRQAREWRMGQALPASEPQLPALHPVLPALIRLLPVLREGMAGGTGSGSGAAAGAGGTPAAAPAPARASPSPHAPRAPAAPQDRALACFFVLNALSVMDGMAVHRGWATGSEPLALLMLRASMLQTWRYAAVTARSLAFSAARLNKWAERAARRAGRVAQRWAWDDEPAEDGDDAGTEASPSLARNAVAVPPPSLARLREEAGALPPTLQVSRYELLAAGDVDAYPTPPQLLSTEGVRAALGPDWAKACNPPAGPLPEGERPDLRPLARAAVVALAAALREGGHACLSASRHRQNLERASALLAWTPPGPGALAFPAPSASFFSPSSPADKELEEALRLLQSMVELTGGSPPTAADVRPAAESAGKRR